MERRADARVGLRADDEEPPDAEARQHGLERGVLEGVAVALLDERLGVVRGQLGDDLPAVAPLRQVLVGVLDPDDGDLLPPCLLDEAADVRDDRVSLVGALDDAVLDVDDEEGGVRPVLECGHDRRLSNVARPGRLRACERPRRSGAFRLVRRAGTVHARLRLGPPRSRSAGWGDATVSATRSCADRSQAMSSASSVRLAPAAAPTMVVSEREHAGRRVEPEPGAHERPADRCRRARRPSSRPASRDAPRPSRCPRPIGSADREAGEQLVVERDGGHGRERRSGRRRTSRRDRARPGTATAATRSPCARSCRALRTRRHISSSESEREQREAHHRAGDDPWRSPSASRPGVKSIVRWRVEGVVDLPAVEERVDQVAARRGLVASRSRSCARSPAARPGGRSAGAAAARAVAS